LALAERVIEAADIQPGQRVLEPSAGMGNLLVPLDRALTARNSASGEATPGAADKVAVEINPSLSNVSCVSVCLVCMCIKATFCTATAIWGSLIVWS
jgi:hypothetical protein